MAQAAARTAFKSGDHQTLARVIRLKPYKNTNHSLHGSFSRVPTFSTGAPTDKRTSQEEGSGKMGPQARLIAARNAVQVFFAPFFQGTKILWNDIRACREVSLRKKRGEAISFREQRLLRQVPRDVVKALPLMVVFAVPVLGYLAPALGLMYPKALLPWQFWTPAQRSTFMRQDALTQEVRTFPDALWYLARLDNPPRADLCVEEFRSWGRWFAHAGRLENLSRAHLKQLVRVCNPIPPLKKASVSVMPKRVLAAWLRKEARYISTDDLILRRLAREGSLCLQMTSDPSTLTKIKDVSSYSSEGLRAAGESSDGDVSEEEYRNRESPHDENFLNILSAEELAVLCWERGILRSDHSVPQQMDWQKGDTAPGNTQDVDMGMSETLIRRLRGWLRLYPVSESTLHHEDCSRLAPQGGEPDGGREESVHAVSSNMNHRVVSGNVRDMARDRQGYLHDHLPASMVVHAPAILRLPIGVSQAPLIQRA